MASIGLMPVSSGSFTPWRCTTPGALNSAGLVSVVFTSPLPSSGLPSGSTIRPSSASPTGTSSRRPVRLTWSPSSILSHAPKSTAPTLSDSRFSASPVTSWGSSSSSIDMQLSRPCMREMPSATESTVPTSDRSAPPSSSPSMRCLRMLVISSGLICTSKSPYAAFVTCFRSCSSLLRTLASSTMFPTRTTKPAEHVRVHVGAQLHALARSAPRCACRCPARARRPAPRRS